MQLWWNRRIVALILLDLALMSLNANGQRPQHQQQPTDPSSEDGGLIRELESMSEKQLELLCIERGFELIHDEGGEPLTHADYVEAARRCLAIEEDMNEILEQNPDLAEELLLEVERMKEEKARLERERDAMLEESKRLEDQIAQKQQQPQPEDTKTDEPPRVWGGGSVTSTTTADSQKTGISAESDALATDGSTKSSPGSAGIPPSSGPDISFFSNRPPPPAVTEHAAGTIDENHADNIDKQDYIHSVVEEEERTTTSSEPTTTTTTADLTITTSAPDDDAVTETKPKTDFSLRAFLQEFASTMENDVRKISSLILPVVKPLFSAGDTAWKYLRILFSGARRFSERFQQAKQRQQQPAQDSDAKSNQESGTII